MLKHVDGFKTTQYQNVTLSVPVDRESPPTDIHVAKKMDVPWGSVEAFDFQPDNLTFSTAARLSVNIDDLLLPPGVKKDSLRVAALDGNSWKILPVGGFPGPSGSVTALLHHLSLYGLLPAPGETSGVGSELSLNGVTLTASEEVHAVLRVTPGIVVAYLGQKPGRVVSIVLSGLPETGEHFMYVAGITNPFPVVGGSASVTLALDEPKVLWIQPFRATVHIGGPADQCSMVGYRDGNRCTLTTDITGEISIDGDDQTLDCNGHLLTQYASYPGSGIGILVSGRTGVLIENCHIGAGSAGYGDGVLVDFSSDVTVRGCEIESSDVAVELVSSSGCTVQENVVSGETREGIILRDDSFGNTVSGNSASTTLEEGTTSLALRGAIYISDIGEDIIVLVRENVIEENTFEGAESGILFSLTGDNDVRRNDVSSTGDAVKIFNTEWTDRLYHNNINGEVHGAYSESAPVELSYAGEGNYWGRNCPGPLFISGEDSNRSDVVDSHAFGEPDAWDLGLPPGCGPAGDMDWDGIPDGVDNCPTVWNPGQDNVDGENEGDACDVTPPEAPVITYPVHGGIFDFAIGMVQGAAELRSLVKIYEAGQVIAQGFADDAGSFSLDLDEPFSNGFHAIRAFSKDAAGNISVPSDFVAFEISLYPPGPPMILKPAQGEIVNSAIVEVSGTALPEEMVSVFIDDAFSGSGFADAMGNFSIPSILEISDGEHWARAQAIDGFGRMSDFSEAVTFSVFAVSPESPIVGEIGRLSITGISDGPDPFYPSLDTAMFHVDALMQAVEGLQGKSPRITFSSTCSLSIRNAESGETIRILDGSVDITGAPVSGGKIAIEQDLAWDGKDASGAFVPAGEIFVYDLDMSTLKMHENPEARCGRAPCVLDEVHVTSIGTVSTTPLPRPVHRILFVSNGQYLQEQAILEHFQVINEAGEGEFFSVQVLPDYKITGNLDLGSAHAVILTEFSPIIPAEGLLNLRNAGKPILIVEHEKFNFSQYFNLVTAPGSIPAHTESIEVATHEHPATYYLGEVEKVFAGPQAAYAVPPSAIPQEIMPLMLDPASGDVMTLADNANAILATGLSDTTRFSAKGWVIFDLFLSFLHPTARPWDQDPGAAVDALMGPGIMGFLSDVGKNPLNWTYDSALERIWPPMVRQDLIFFLPEMDDLIPRMLDLSHGWRFEIYRSPIYGSTRAVLYHRTIEGMDYETDCKTWYDSLTGAGEYLPNNIMYDSTQAGGIPLFDFTALDGTHMFLETLDPFINDAFTVTLFNVASVKILPGPPPYGTGIMVFNSGASTLLDKNELYPDLAPSASADEFVWYWWGRKNSYLDPREVSKYPFKFKDYAWYDINLDMYKYIPETIKSQDNLICLARFFYLWPPVLDAPTYGALPKFQYESEEATLPLEPFVDLDCEYPGDFDAFDPMFKDTGLPNTFMDAVGPAGELLPRMQLVEPSNPFLSKNHRIENWCEDNVDVCSDLSNATNKAAFMDEFQNSVPAGYEPYEHITPRHRTDVRWGGSSGSGDRGPWQKPHLTAGIDTTVRVLIRREDHALPLLYDDAVCKPTDASYFNVAWLVYTDSSGFIHDPENTEWGNLVEAAHDGTLPSGSSPFRDLIVFMPCHKTVAEVRISDPYEGAAADLLTDQDLYNLSEDEGLTYTSMYLPLSADPTGWKRSAISVPFDAEGLAKIVWEGEVVLSLRSPIHGGTVEDVSVQRREFPVYIDPIDESMGTAALLNSRPICWIGATRNMLRRDGTVWRLGGSSGAPNVPSQVDFNPLVPGNPNSWLLGGDFGTWARIEDAGGSRLYALFGDIGIHWPGPTDPEIPFSWFEYRGSTLAFFQHDESGVPQYIRGYGDGPAEADFSCPVMLPELLDDEAEYAGMPWEMVHADGTNSENAIWDKYEEALYQCQETSSETVAATAVFQTHGQIDAGEGEAYIWFGNVADWGTQAGSYRILPDEPQGYYNPLLPFASAYLYAYDKEFPAWYSFLAKWDSGGVDEMARSVKWGGDLGQFKVNAVMAVDSLANHIDGAPSVPGILVWHTGRYRASDVYLSYAEEEDILSPGSYWHFAGTPSGVAEWTSDLGQAVPVIMDFVGELSAVCYPPEQCDGVRGEGDTPYKVLYHVTTSGQSGIVMRQAYNPWGIYGDKIPLFDCFAKERELEASSSEIVIMSPEAGGACYGGFTHKDLWHPTPDSSGTKIQFNVSMWRPYKVLLVQTEWSE